MRKEDREVVIDQVFCHCDKPKTDRCGRCKLCGKFSEIIDQSILKFYEQAKQIIQKVRGEK